MCFCAYCRILASLKHPHIVAFYESVYDADKQVLYIIHVIIIIIFFINDTCKVLNCQRLTYAVIVS